ncbi:MAG: hemolysin family protein [Lagierella massiliensis]|nr:hemolysin family protein [Lagierella massiliensis]
MGDTLPDVPKQIAILLILTALNGFFAAAEMAVVSVDRKKINYLSEEKNNKRAKILLNLVKEPSRFLSTIQVGITLAGFFSAGSASIGLSKELAKVFNELGIPYSENLSFVVLTVILAYFNLVFGELVPKRIALQNAEKFSLGSISIINFFYKIMRPFVFLLSATTNGVLRLLGQDISGMEAKVTLEEIKSIVEVGQEQGIIDPVEREMIDSVISFDDTLAEDIMTARTEVFCIDILTPVDEYIDQMMELKYSRIPVYEDDIDNIIGILYIKDFMKEAYENGFNNVDIRKIIKPAFFVPERKNINDLFLELQESKVHFAVLIDEYGGFSGIVTMEDLIEEIMGDIYDEYDVDEPDFKVINENTFLIKGNLEIDELNYRLGSKFDEDTEDYDTVAGLIFFHLGYIPRDGEKPSLDVDGVKFNVEIVKNKRIELVKVILTEEFHKRDESEENEEY